MENKNNIFFKLLKTSRILYWIESMSKIYIISLYCIPWTKVLNTPLREQVQRNKDTCLWIVLSRDSRQTQEREKKSEGLRKKMDLFVFVFVEVKRWCESWEGCVSIYKEFVTPIWVVGYSGNELFYVFMGCQFRPTQAFSGEYYFSNPIVFSCALQKFQKYPWSRKYNPNHIVSVSGN
jgi:hypothetical protein